MEWAPPVLTRPKKAGTGELANKRAGTRVDRRRSRRVSLAMQADRCRGRTAGEEGRKANGEAEGARGEVTEVTRLCGPAKLHPQPVPCCPSGASTQQRNSQRCFLELLSEHGSSCESARPLERRRMRSPLGGFTSCYHRQTRGTRSGVASSLASQGSPLAGAQASVFVQPYTTSGAPACDGAPGSATLTAVVAGVAIVALATGLFHCKQHANLAF